MARRSRPHPAARSRRFVGWASLGVATTLGGAMAVSAALAPASAGASNTPSSNGSSVNGSSSKGSTAKGSTPTTAVPRKSTPAPKARSKAS